MWQNVAATILLMFGVIVAVVVVIIYLRMYRKHNKSQEQGHESTSFANSNKDKQTLP